MFYRHVGGRNQFDQRSFYGQRISDDDLNYDRPWICPPCLKQRPITFCNFAEGPAATGARRPILVTEIVEFFLGASVTTEETK